MNRLQPDWVGLGSDAFFEEMESLVLPGVRRLADALAQAIYDEINQLEKSAVEVEVFNRYQELISWLLLPAAILLIAELVLRRTAFKTAP